MDIYTPRTLTLNFLSPEVTKLPGLVRYLHGKLYLTLSNILRYRNTSKSKTIVIKERIVEKHAHNNLCF